MYWCPEKEEEELCTLRKHHIHFIVSHTLSHNVLMLKQQVQCNECSMYFARKHIASHRKTCHMYRYIRQCVYCDEMHPREEDHDCEEGRAARRKKRMQMMREKREREKKEQKALEKIAVPLKKISSLEKIAVNSDFVVDDYNVEGSMHVEETDGTFSECRLYRHKSKKRNVVLYFGNGLFEGLDLNYTFENGKLKDDDGQLITYVLLNHFHIIMFQLRSKEHHSQRNHSNVRMQTQ